MRNKALSFLQTQYNGLMETAKGLDNACNAYDVSNTGDLRRSKAAHTALLLYN
jgi:hypothetical protein